MTSIADTTYSALENIPNVQPSALSPTSQVDPMTPQQEVTPKRPKALILRPASPTSELTPPPPSPKAMSRELKPLDRGNSRSAAPSNFQRSPRTQRPISLATDPYAQNSHHGSDVQTSRILELDQQIKISAKEHRIVLRKEMAELEEAEKRYNENSERFELMNRRVQALMNLVAGDTYREAAVMKKRESLLSQRQREAIVTDWEDHRQSQTNISQPSPARPSPVPSRQLTQSQVQLEESEQTDNRASPSLGRQVSVSSPSPSHVHEVADAHTVLVALAESRRALSKKVAQNQQQNEAERAAYCADLNRQRDDGAIAAAQRREAWYKSTVARAKTQSSKLDRVRAAQQALQQQKEQESHMLEQNVLQRQQNAEKNRSQSLANVTGRLAEKHKYETEVDLIKETAPPLPPVYKAHLLAEEARQSDERARRSAAILQAKPKASRAASPVLSSAQEQSSSPQPSQPHCARSPRKSIIKYSDDVLDEEIRKMGLEPLGNVPVFSSRAAEQQSVKRSQQPSGDDPEAQSDAVPSKSQVKRVFPRRKPFNVAALTLDRSILAKNQENNFRSTTTQPFSASNASLDPWSRLYLAPLIRAATVPPAPPGHELVVVKKPRKQPKSPALPTASSPDSEPQKPTVSTSKSTDSALGSGSDSSTAMPVDSVAEAGDEVTHSRPPAPTKPEQDPTGSQSTGWLAEDEMRGRSRHVQRKILLSSRLALYRHNMAALRIAKAEESVAAKRKERADILAAQTQSHVRRTEEAAQRYRALEEEARTETQLSAKERAERAAAVLDALRKERDAQMGARRAQNIQNSAKAMEYAKQRENEKQSALVKREKEREAMVTNARELMTKENQLIRQQRHQSQELRNVRQKSLRLQAETELLEVRTEQLSKRLTLLERVVSMTTEYNDKVE